MKKSYMIIFSIVFSIITLVVNLISDISFNKPQALNFFVSFVFLTLWVITIILQAKERNIKGLSFSLVTWAYFLISFWITIFSNSKLIHGIFMMVFWGTSELFYGFGLGVSPQIGRLISISTGIAVVSFIIILLMYVAKKIKYDEQ